MRLIPRIIVPAFWLCAISAVSACDTRQTSMTSPSLRPDSTAIRNRMLPVRANLLQAVTAAGVPIRKGQGVTFTVEIDNGRCEDVAVSGPINATLWSHVGTPDACTGSTQPRALGPATEGGELVVSLPLTPHQTRVSGSGSLWMVEIDDAPGGTGDGDYNDIIVTIQFDKLSEPTLECSPNPVQRGLKVRCGIFIGQAARLVRRRTTGADFVIDEVPNTTHEATQTYVWEGPAVANTRMELTFEVNEGPKVVQKRYRAQFRVSPREWPALQLQPSQIDVGLRGEMQAYPGNRLLGNAAPNLTISNFQRLQVITVEPGGPNAGLTYLRDPLPAVPHLIYIHPGLYNASQFPNEPSQRWHVDQNGTPNGTCDGSVFGPLLAAVLRHEGATGDPLSHWGITDEFYRTRRPERRIERLYAQGNDEQLRAKAWTEWVAIHNTGEHNQKQDAFDASDYPKIVNSLGCDLDFDISNK